MMLVVIKLDIPKIINHELCVFQDCGSDGGHNSYVCQSGMHGYSFNIAKDTYIKWTMHNAIQICTNMTTKINCIIIIYN